MATENLLKVGFVFNEIYCEKTLPILKKLGWSEFGERL